VSVESEIRRILFVCTGNTCRSPMAEGIATRLADELALSSIQFRSAGTSAYRGVPASSHALAVAWSHGIDLGHHRSSRLTRELAGWSDLVVGMTPGHLRSAAMVVPGVSVMLLTDLLPAEDRRRGSPVPDPFGGDAAMYAETFDLVYASLNEYLRGRAQGDSLRT
jgi:protein-tyrosine-phosphatase